MEKAYLEQLSPDGSRVRHGPLSGLTALGRGRMSTIRVDDRAVSRLHAQIRRDSDGTWVLEDLRSRSGTYVGGERVQRHELHSGEEIRLGSTLLYFELEQDEGRTVYAMPSAATNTMSMTQQGTKEMTVVMPRMNAAALKVMLEGSLTAHGAQASVEVAADTFLPSDQIHDINVLREDYDKLRIASEIVASLRPDAPLDELLRNIVLRTFDIVSARRCAILLYDEGRGGMEPRLVLERGGTEPTDPLPISETLLGKVCMERRAILIGDAMADDELGGAHSIVAAALRSVMCVPVIHEDDLFGAMYVDTSQRSSVFTEKDLKIFTVIARQLGVALYNAQLIQQVREETKSRVMLSRFISPNMVQEVVSGQVSMARKGESREVAVMFTDIRGFTAMSEKMEASDVTAMLNEYFDVMVDVLFRHGGTLDKYIGDAIMATFGVPKSDPQASEKSVRAAVDMLRALERLNGVRAARGEAPITMGIGICYGKVSWGPLGSRETMDYTVVGDTVNTASRLCSKAAAGEIIVSESVRTALPSDVAVAELPPLPVKGKAEPLNVFRIDGWREEGLG